MTGIYCIENKINGKKYVGQAADVEARWRHHRCLLNSNRHHSVALQRAWNKYSKDAFEFYMLEQCEADQLNELEKKWIEKLNTFGKDYNMTKGGEGQLGTKLSDGRKKHLSKINMGPLNPNYGLKRSLETRQKMSKAMSFKRGPMSDIHKNKISKACKNIKHESQNKSVLWVEAQKAFKSISDASEKTGFSISGISKVCLGQRKAIYNQHFMFIQEG